MKRLTGLCIAALCLVMLSGCWDMKEIQELNYITAIGIDYKDETFIVYVQMLDFSNVARQESGKPTEQAPVWVGRGAGRTLSDAISNLYTSVQQRIAWGHVTALVFSESILKKGKLSQVFELSDRSREFRYTKWVFGTNEAMDSLFSTTPFFRLSPLASLLHEPMEVYKQFSFVVPLQFHEFIMAAKESAGTVSLPSLGKTKTDWSENLKQHALLEITGAYFLGDGQYKGWLDRKELAGMRWIRSRLSSAPVVVESDGTPIGTVNLSSPKPRVQVRRDGDKPKFEIHISLKGKVNSIIEDTKVKTLEHLTAEQIKKEIEESYKAGLKINADVLELLLPLYRRQPALWHEIESESKKLNEQSVQQIDISVHIRNWGQRKKMTM